MKRLRVVLDTNVIVSAMLFTGKASYLVDKWKSGSIILLATKEIIREYLRVLAYPKFGLNQIEIETLLNQEILPYIETIKTKGVSPALSRDPDDDKFLACAAAGKADFIVSGDDDLLTLQRIGKCPIIAVDEFMKIVS